MRVPLIDGHGNFGSLDDGPAAARYTEARINPAALRLTENLDEDVVDFVPNYDGSSSSRHVCLQPTRICSSMYHGNRGRHGDKHVAPTTSSR